MTFLLKCDFLVSPMLDHFHFASLGALSKTQDISITELRHPGVDEARSVESNFHLNLSSGFQGSIKVQDFNGFQTWKMVQKCWKAQNGWWIGDISEISGPSTSNPKLDQAKSNPTGSGVVPPISSHVFDANCAELIPIIHFHHPGWTVHSKHSNDPPPEAGAFVDPLLFSWILIRLVHLIRRALRVRVRPDLGTGHWE